MFDVDSLKNTILRDIELDHLPDGQREAIVAELIELILERTQFEIWKRLSVDDRKVFAFLKEPLEIDAFMKTRVPNLDSILEMSASLTLQHFKLSLSK